MADPIPSPEELASMEARCAAATPGPWEQWVDHGIVMAGPSKRNTPDSFGGGRGQVANCDSDDFGEDEEDGAFVAAENAAFIASARTDVPRLIAAVRALTASPPAPTADAEATARGIAGPCMSNCAAFPSRERCANDKMFARISAALSAARAQERERCAGIASPNMQSILLACGELSAQEKRAVNAVLGWVRSRIAPPSPAACAECGGSRVVQPADDPCPACSKPGPAGGAK